VSASDSSSSDSSSSIVAVCCSMFQCVPACCSVLQCAAGSLSPGSPHLVCMYVELFGMRSHMIRRDSLVRISYLRTQPTPSVAVSVCLYPHPRTTPTHCSPSHRVSRYLHFLCGLMLYACFLLTRCGDGTLVSLLTNSCTLLNNQTRKPL